MRTKLRKIYYVPGLVSAIITPLLFWYLGSEKLKEPIPNLMDFAIVAKYNPNIPIDKQYSFEAFRKWNYKKINVHSNSAKENSKYYVAELKNLQARNEKDTGIEFILNENNSYGDFASILNDFHIVKQERFGLDLEKTGHLFAIVDYKDPLKENLEYPYYFCDHVIRDEYQMNCTEKIQNELSHLPEKAYYIIFSFLIFLNISMLNIKKFI